METLLTIQNRKPVKPYYFHGHLSMLSCREDQGKNRQKNVLGKCSCAQRFNNFFRKTGYLINRQIFMPSVGKMSRFVSFLKFLKSVSGGVVTFERRATALTAKAFWPCSVVNKSCLHVMTSY
jgi:hypothetical protein